MKKFLILIFALSFVACNNETNAWETFKHKYAGQGTTIRVNGLMKLALGMYIDEADPEMQKAMDLLKKMKGVEINIMDDDQSHFSQEEVLNLVHKLNKSAYEPLINIRHGSDLINLWAKGNKNTFSDPLALINTGDEVIMVEMKGTLTTSDIQMLTRAGSIAIGN